jgi:outer membrane protein OmpA-like peptidoglycan-associated protein
LESAQDSVSSETGEDSRISGPTIESPTETERSIEESDKADSATKPESVERTLPYPSDIDQTNESSELPTDATAQPVEQTQPAPLPVAADKAASIEKIVYFSPNNTAINQDASLLLKELVVELKNNADAVVEISGHCAMSGTEEGREELSRERAYNIVAYLKQEGWTPEIEPVVRWYGGTRPVTSDPTQIHRNRRVEITVNIP